jgi:hypothetical protein
MEETSYGKLLEAVRVGPQVAELSDFYVLTYLLTEQSASWEAANCAATQWLLRKWRK